MFVVMLVFLLSVHYDCLLITVNSAIYPSTDYLIYVLKIEKPLGL